MYHFFENKDLKYNEFHRIFSHSPFLRVMKRIFVAYFGYNK